jgi:hypothetical protein
MLVLIPLFGNQVKAQVGPPWNTDLDSIIAFYVDKVNADSIQSYMQALEDMGTRFCLANNRREVSVWIKNKFIDLGYPNTVLDSFPFNTWYGGSYYQTWQFNVVSTMEGYERPDNVYILGAHHDAIVPQSSNPFIIAPGADDNASGTAAALEVARIMKQYNYQPEATIKFITFAAEELGLHGAWHYANKAASENMNIKMMINNDMISYCTVPQSQWTLRIQKYPNSLWVTNLATYIATNFTVLNVTESTQYIQYSDSWPFYSNGYNAIFLQENQFTPYYHTVNDLVSTLNMDYTAEMIKVSLGMLIYENGPGLNTGINEMPVRPLATLHPNFPNPFATQTTIKYTMQEPGWMSLRVFDASNRVVSVLHDGWMDSGSHWTTFNALTLPAGLYFCQMQTETQTATIKLMVKR